MSNFDWAFVKRYDPLPQHSFNLTCYISFALRCLFNKKHTCRFLKYT